MRRCFQESVPEEDTYKLLKRCTKWIVEVHKYVSSMNKVLNTDIGERNAAWEDMMDSLNPPKVIAKKLGLANFLQSRFAVWTQLPVMKQTSDKPGFLTCVICETEHKFPKQERALAHICSKDHHDALKKKMDAAVTARSKDLMNDHVHTFNESAEAVAAVQNYAVQYCAAKSLPFAAAEMTLDCVSAAFATIFPEHVDTKLISDLGASRRKSHRKASHVLRTINHLRSHVDTGGRVKRRLDLDGDKDQERPKRSRFRLHRTTVSKRVTRLADDILKQKRCYLLKCPYLGLIVDEGNNFARSSPVYAAIISCDDEYNWRVQYVGQEDCGGRKTGEDIYNLVKKIFVGQDMMDVWKKICCVGTDGAAVMRSISKYCGLDCNNLRGKSFSAFVKRDLGELVDFWHCLCHVLNLSLNDALNLIVALKLYFIPHLRMCHSEFKRSSNNRADYKRLYEQLKDLDATYNWRIYYPALFCITRWLGLWLCSHIMGSRSNRVLMVKYRELLRRKGYGPRQFDAYKYRRHRNIEAAVDAGADDRAGDETDSDDDSEDEEADRVRHAIADGRLTEDDDYIRQPRVYRTVQDAVEAAPAQTDLVDADGFDVGDTDVPKYKLKNMLNPDVGLTDLNSGRSCYLSGVLKVYKVLVESLQKSTTPEQHLASRRIRQFFMVMQKSWIGSSTTEPMYSCKAFQDWIEDMEVKNKTRLIALVKQECRSFSSILVASLRSRLRATWQHIQALELIDPLGPDIDQHATPAVWAALKDLCRRRHLDFHLCQTQILAIRTAAPNLDQQSRAMIRMDLCGYLRDRRQMFQMTFTPSPTAEYDNLCIAVLSIPLTSSFVESLFSKMVYNQSKIRSRMSDAKMSAILHLHDSALADPQTILPSAIQLKVMIPRTLRDELTMSKHMGDKVCCVFEGTRFHGEVTEVIFHEIHAQYMYRVTYSDGDVCDYWRHELAMIECKCILDSDTDDSNP